MKTDYMRTDVYPGLLGRHGRVKLGVADYIERMDTDGVEITGDPAHHLGNRVKAGLMMTGVAKDEGERIVHRCFTFGPDGCLNAEWQRDADGEPTALVVKLVDAPRFWNPDLGDGRVPVQILRHATNDGARKLHPHVRDALMVVTDAVAGAEAGSNLGSLENSLQRLVELGIL